MKGYFVFEEDVLNQAEFERYKSLSPQSIKKYGGEFLVRGGEVEALEGGFNYQRLVIIAFPSVEAAKSWYHSEEYAEAKDLRLRISKGNALLVAGL